MGEALITRRGGAPKFEEVAGKNYQGGGGLFWRNVAFDNTTYYLVTFITVADPSDYNLLTNILLADAFITNGVVTPLHLGDYLSVGISGGMLNVNGAYANTYAGDAYLYKL